MSLMPEPPVQRSGWQWAGSQPQLAGSHRVQQLLQRYAEDEYGHRAGARYLLCHTSQRPTLEASSSMTCDDNEIALLLLCSIEDGQGFWTGKQCHLRFNSGQAVRLCGF